MPGIVSRWPSRWFVTPARAHAQPIQRRHDLVARDRYTDRHFSAFAFVFSPRLPRLARVLAEIPAVPGLLAAKDFTLTVQAYLLKNMTKLCSTFSHDPS